LGISSHGFTGKDKPYHPAVEVPLIISGPGIRKNISNSKPTATLDLTATFLDYAKIAVPSQMDSKPLRYCLESGEYMNRKFVTSARGNWRMVYDGRYKLIDNKNAGVKFKF
jgi:arylsulfatase A-like enzyme